MATDGDGGGPPNSDEAIARALEQLSARVAALEAGLADVRQRPVDSQVPPPVPPPVMPPVMPAVEAWAREDAAKRAPQAAPTHAEASAAAGAGLEGQIGARWYGAAGAIAVVVGLGLFTKLAYDEGWLRVPPAMRCVLVALAGVVLLLTGEAVRRRITRAGAIAIFAAGLGALYAAPIAAAELYGLLSTVVTLVLVLVVAGGGVALSLRERSATLAVLSLAGAFVGPLIVWSPTPSLVLLPGYALIVMASGLWLSWRKGGGFVYAGLTAWIGSCVLGGAWAESLRYADAAESEWSLVVFGLLAWGLVQAEAIGYARRRDVRAEDTETVLRAVVVVTHTALATMFVASAAEAYGLPEEWHVTGVLSLASAACGWACTRDGTREVGEEVGEKVGERGGADRVLAATLLWCAGALLLVTLAIALDAGAAVLAWAVLGAGAAIAGKVRRVRGLVIAGLLAVGATVFRLIALEGNGELAFEPWLGMGWALTGFAGFAWTKWMWLMLACGACAAVVAWCARGAEEAGDWGDARNGGGLARLAAAVAMITLLAAPVHEHARASSIAAWALALAAAAIAGRWLEARAGLARSPSSLGKVAAGALVWGLVVIVKHAANAKWTTGLPLVHASFLLVFAWCATGAWLVHVAGRNVGVATRVTLVSVVGTVALVGSSMEAATMVDWATGDRAARAAAVSVWWGVCGVSMIALGFVRGQPSGSGFAWGPIVRKVGLGLLGVAALKVVVVDLVGVSAWARVVSFLGVGVLMLGVGVAYARISKRLAGGVGGAAGSGMSEGTGAGGGGSSTMGA